MYTCVLLFVNLNKIKYLLKMCFSLKELKMKIKNFPSICLLLLNYRTMRYAISVYIIYLQNMNINNIKIHLYYICLTGALVHYIKKRN